MVVIGGCPLLVLVLVVLVVLSGAGAGWWCWWCVYVRGGIQAYVVEYSGAIVGMVAKGRTTAPPVGWGHSVLQDSLRQNGVCESNRCYLGCFLYNSFLIILLIGEPRMR